MIEHVTEESRRRAIADAKSIVEYAHHGEPPTWVRERDIEWIVNVCEVLEALEGELADTRSDLTECKADLQAMEDAELRDDTRAMLRRQRELERRLEEAEAKLAKVEDERDRLRVERAELGAALDLYANSTTEH